MLNLIPIHDENPTWRTAWVTITLIALNLVVFLLEPVAFSFSGNPASAADACHQEAFFRRYAAIPRELTTNRQLPRTITETRPPRVEGNQVACPVGRPTYDKLPALSVLYAMFLHGSWLHLLGNMLFLWVFGNNVEDRLGRVRYLLFYLLCGYAATYGFALADPGSTTTLVGASGAIAGVLGAYLVMFPRARVTSLVPFLLFLPARLPAWVVLGSWFVLQYFYASGASIGTGAGVAYLAHVVGFIAGIVLIILLGGLSQRRRPPPPTWQQSQSPYR
jgi:membrane associated rhomboid family serine protease